MRDWLNSIFALIGSTSLTDVEFDSINFLNLTTNVYNQAAYDELSKVLVSRESVSTIQDKLVALFVIKGVNVTPAKIGRSNILVGAVLE